MGTDNLHHKNKAKKERDLLRTKKQRKGFDKILIVTEGEKTEPHYLKELRREFRIRNVDVEIDGNCGSSPKSILEHAEKKYFEASKTQDPFDRVYCVFDKDTHETYQSTIDKISRKRPKNTYFAITSVPCFEVWLLLHFEYYSKPFASSGDKSAAKMVVNELKRFISDYEKNAKGIFQRLYNRLDKAKSNAKRLTESNIEQEVDNPSTTTQDLIEYLESQRRN